MLFVLCWLLRVLSGAVGARRGCLSLLTIRPGSTPRYCHEMCACVVVKEQEAQHHWLDAGGRHCGQKIQLLLARHADQRVFSFEG